MERIILAAVARNNVIGKDGTLPWHIPSELQFFKKTTMGHTLIMGRRTFESFGKPLHGRKNIVVTKSVEKFQNSDVVAVNNLENADKLALNDSKKNIFYIGGYSIYKYALNIAERMIISRIRGKYEGDTFFPLFDKEQWKMVSITSKEQFEVEEYVNTEPKSV